MQKVTNSRKQGVIRTDNNNQTNTLKRKCEVESAGEQSKKRRSTEPKINNSLENNKNINVRDLKRKRDEKGPDDAQGSPKKVQKGTQTKSRGVVDLTKQKPATKNENILALPRQYFINGKYDEVIKIIEQKLNTGGLNNKTQSDLHLTSAMAHFMKGDDLSFSADDELDTGLKILYHDTENYSFKNAKCKFYYNLSVSLLNKKDYARAERAARSGIEVKNMDPMKSELYLCLSKSYSLQKKYDAAIHAASLGLGFVSSKSCGDSIREKFNNILKECDKSKSNVPSKYIDYSNLEGIYSQGLETYLETESSTTSFDYSSSTVEMETEMEEYFNSIQ